VCNARDDAIRDVSTTVLASRYFVLMSGPYGHPPTTSKGKLQCNGYISGSTNAKGFGSITPDTEVKICRSFSASKATGRKDAQGGQKVSSIHQPVEVQAGGELNAAYSVRGNRESRSIDPVFISAASHRQSTRTSPMAQLERSLPLPPSTTRKATEHISGAARAGPRAGDCRPGLTSPPQGGPARPGKWSRASD